MIEYPYDIHGLHGVLNPESGSEDESGASNNVEIRVNNARINMSFVNAVPLGMSIEASPIDTVGNVLPVSDGIEVSMVAEDGSQAVIAPGSIEAPATTRVAIELKASADAMKKLDGFRLGITGTSSAETAGIQLNAGQYIQITDMSVNFDGGVDMEL